MNEDASGANETRPLGLGDVHGAAAVAAIAGTSTVAHRREIAELSRDELEAEGLPVETLSGLPLLVEDDAVLGTPQAEVREVVQHVAEDPLAVLLVLRRVEDVGVPHRVDLLRGNDAVVRVHGAELQEVAVLGDELVGLLDGHADDVEVRVDQLEGDRLQIERVDRGQLLVDGQVGSHANHLAFLFKDTSRITG